MIAYVTVDDISATLERAVKAGGQALMVLPASRGS
jgi:predicted enzyme related to lactoylglutathione lyase